MPCTVYIFNLTFQILHIIKSNKTGCGQSSVPFLWALLLENVDLHYFLLLFTPQILIIKRHMYITYHLNDIPICVYNFTSTFICVSHVSYLLPFVTVHHTSSLSCYPWTNPKPCRRRRRSFPPPLIRSCARADHLPPRAGAGSNFSAWRTDSTSAGSAGNHGGNNVYIDQLSGRFMASFCCNGELVGRLSGTQHRRLLPVSRPAICLPQAA